MELIAEPEWAVISDEERIADGLRRNPVTNFEAYPAAIRPYLQRWQVEDEICRGIPHSASQRACNRRYVVHVALERRGWCWGGGRFEAEMRWLRCVDEKSYEPGRLEAAGPPFSELKIALLEDEERRLRGQPGLERLPALLAEFRSASARALADPVDEGLRRQFPLSRYPRLPAEIRLLAQRADVEEQACEAGLAEDRAVRFRACNRSIYLQIELAHMGWCRTADDGWDRCTAGNATPRELIEGSHIYPESDIRWEQSREQRRGRNADAGLN